MDNNLTEKFTYTDLEFQRKFDETAPLNMMMEENGKEKPNLKPSKRPSTPRLIKRKKVPPASCKLLISNFLNNILYNLDYKSFLRDIQLPI